jgi:hypothetical protein
MTMGLIPVVLALKDWIRIRRSFSKTVEIDIDCSQRALKKGAVSGIAPTLLDF